MQEQGVRHDDPEYLKAHNLLAAVQRQQVFQKQKQMQQLQTRQRQQQLNGATPDGSTNGVDGRSAQDIWRGPIANKATQAETVQRPLPPVYLGMPPRRPQELSRSFLVRPPPKSLPR